MKLVSCRKPQRQQEVADMSRRVVQGQSGSAKSKIFPRLGGDTGPSGVNDTERALRASSHDASGVAQAQEEQQRAAERVCGLPVPSCTVGLGKLSGPRSREGRRDANSPTAPLSQGVQGEGRFDVRGTTRTRKGEEEFSSPEISRSPRNSDSQCVWNFFCKKIVYTACEHCRWACSSPHLCPCLALFFVVTTKNC